MGEETTRAYDTYTDEFDEKFERSFMRYVKAYADRFMRHMIGKEILDLGSGPGHHAEHFKNAGYNVLCIDSSYKMVEKCRSKGLQALVVDMENLEVMRKFDGIWAFASLLHLEKGKMREMIVKAKDWLNKDGIIGLGLKEGIGEGFEIDERYPGTRRWFSYYTDEDVRRIVEPHFTIVDATSGRTDEFPFLNYILRR